MRSARPFLVILFFLILGNQSHASGPGRRDILKRDREIIEIRTARKDQFMNFYRKSSEINACIRNGSDISAKIIEVDKSIADLEKLCGKAQLIQEEEHINCLKAVNKSSFSIKGLVTFLKSAQCSRFTNELEQLEKELNPLLLLLEKDSVISKENYQNFLLNKFASHRARVIKNIQDKAKIFNCEMKFLNTLEKVALWSTKVKSYFYMGDLYALGKGLKTLQVLNRYLETTNRVCELGNDSDLELVQEKVNGLVDRFRDANYKQMSDKACANLSRKNIQSNLCDRAIDNDSYRYSLSYELQKGLGYEVR